MGSKLGKVKWFVEPYSFSEDYQRVGTVFSFVSSPKDGQEACHGWVKCRDFLHDAVKAQITNKECSIYRFTFTPGKNPNVDLKKMRMLVSSNDLTKETVPYFKRKIKHALSLLHHFEGQAGVSLSKVEEMDPSESGRISVFMFTSSVMWLKSPALVSMYTFLIRLGDKNIKFRNARGLKRRLEIISQEYMSGKTTDNDAKYLYDTWNKMHTIIKNRTKLFTSKNGFHDIYTNPAYQIGGFHHRCGIVSLAKCASPDIALNERMCDLLSKEVAE